MATMKISHSYLEDLQPEGKTLIEAASALNALFDKEEAHLKREDEASTLRAVYRTIIEQLEQVRRSESFACHGDSRANLIFSLTGLAAKIVVAATTKNQRTWNIVGSVFDTEGRRKPFGTVMVCIGPKGLPDDARAVSISQLARESNRPQTEIMSNLRDNGYLLFSEEAFSLLIENLVGAVRGGKLDLPISTDKMAETTGLNKPAPRIKVIRVK
jgi:hypothetical protein